ncbi:conserved hypothetical protein [Catenulispora acidiphila DSM 44928]|uniref:Ferritin-like domain-containing protein n=1 Tax=Catenulispora acidiphila (strain DSM 44928 / JCM 14897 / NBRC 102108 / NRRL B-24433 / ID139908) TaxID=479433 RepID=C7PXD9_CATAD|nr:ferritin-like domain-containing protein [Catenulispora acidiphila]ACU69490.1 conserved hypothetical protein [Catenulispora acidiphila DSM 44928]
MLTIIDLEGLGLDAGAHLVLNRALTGLPAGGRLAVVGGNQMLGVQLGAWCRSEGHGFDPADPPVVIKGTADDARARATQRAGSPSHVDERADAAWGLAARGALVEPGGPLLSVDWVDRDLVWADVAPRLYSRAAAEQWDPATAIDWASHADVPDEVEDAVVQIMTYLIENEQAALMLPARLLARLHPHFREVMQLFAVQIADEARHVEVFTRRALLSRDELGVSGAGGRASLQTLLDEPDFTLASFLLSVLGEGSFLDLLRFLNVHAPDPITATMTSLVGRDEARHVAFGVAHTAHAAKADARFLGRLRMAVERRHTALIDTAGLNKQVFDALVVLAAGSWETSAIAKGWRAVEELQKRMEDGRRHRLSLIGFPDDEAAELAALHTRNFM